MSIAQGTTYYDYPQVQLTDRPTFADFNPAFADIDGKLHGLITGAETDEQAIADLGTAVGNLSTQLGGVSEVANAAKTKADANEEAITLLGTQVSQNTTKLGTKIDANAIAEPYDATSTYAVDDVVTYQGQRYRCITAVADAEPFDATKWTGEDVQTVLDRIATPTAAGVAYNNTSSGLSATDVQGAIDEVKSGLNRTGYNKIGTEVAISTSSVSPTTFNYDGYVSLSVQNGTSALYLLDANGTTIQAIVKTAVGTGVWQTDMCFVRKGMKGYVTVTDGQALGTYKPFTS